MTSLTKILKAGARTLNLEEEAEALRAIETVARRWAELSPRIEGVTSVVLFIENLDSELEKDDVKTAFAAIGLDDTFERLTAYRDKISAVFEKAGVKHAERLIHPLSQHPESLYTDNTGAVDWSLIDAGDADATADDENGADYDFDLGGKAAIVLEGGALWPYQLENARDRCVRLGVSGKLTAKGDAKVPFSFGSLGASLAADGETSLDYYFEPGDQSQLLCSAAAIRIVHAPNPFDLASVRSAMNSNSDFFGYDLMLNGGITAQMEVAVGKEFDIPAIGRAAIDLELKATLVRRRKFQISLRRLGAPNAIDPDLELFVSGHKKRSKGFDLGVVIVLEFGKLADYVHEQLKPLVNEWDSALSTIKPFLKPGTYLQSKAGNLLSAVVDDLLDHEQIARAIKADMALLLGTSEASSTALGDFLAEEIEGALNRLVSAGFGEAGEQAEQLLGALEARLPLFASLDKDDAALGELKKLIEKLKTDLTSKLEAATSTKTKRENIANTLKRVGADVNRVVASADGALAGIRKLLGEYDATVKKAMDALTKAANRQISLSITYANVKSDDSTVELKATLFSGATQSDFATLLSGNFADLSKLVRNPGPHLSFAEGTTLKRIVTHQETTGGAFIGFGVQADFSTVFSGKAEIEVDHRGNVAILSRGQAQDISTTAFGDKETTEASFFDVISIARAKDAESTPATADILDLGLNLRRKDERGLKSKELRTLIEDMRKQGLITENGAREVSETVNEWIDAGSERAVPAVIDIALPLTGKQIIRVLNANPEQTMRDAVDAQIATGRRSEVIRLAQHNDGLQAALQILHMTSASDLEIMMALARKEWSESDARELAQGSLRGTNYGKRLRAFMTLHSRVAAAWDLIKLSQELRALSTELPIVAGNPEQWDFDRFAKAQQRIARRTRKWLATGQFLIFFGTDGVTEQMAAFFIALGSMAGLSEAEVRDTITLSIQHSKDANKLIVVS
ncbi:MAG: hypothetical protein ABGW84_02885 [Sphingomonadaceae bacterium]